MGDIKAGVTLMQDFCRPKSEIFSGYIDYLDREEAQRNHAIQTFNLFNDYMGNPEKSTGLFTNEKDNLTHSEKRELKDVFQTAQDNESVMWQTVISFDNRWLEQNGIYDSQKQILDEQKLKEVTRLAVNRLLKSEGLEHAVWSAGIHYNTDNLHVHIATVEPYPMREKMMYNGKKEVRGKFKLQNINNCKSAVVNEIMRTKDINLQINNIIRKDIIASAESRNFREDPVIREQFLKLFENLQGVPKHKQNYNSYAIKPFREQIDGISEAYIQKYCKEEYKKFTEILQRQSKLYAEAYGGGNWKLTMDYRMPTKILIEDVLSIGTVKDDTISQRLQKFYSDTTLVRLLSDVEAKYPNLDEVEKGLSKGFRKLKKEVPDTKVPFIYSQVSAFNESIILVDSLLGISLDKYMGEDYPLYKRFYYDYQCRSMRPERIVPDCFAFYLLSRYGMNYHEGTCLIDLMMHTGKINYVVQNLLGYSDIGEAMGYSKEESDWCKDNEKKIWNYICTNDHLHARDPMVIRYYMKPAPAVDMLGAQAPALIGTWMGARIIASYMKKHKDMKLKDLLEFTDYHEMLSESNYLAS